MQFLKKICAALLSAALAASAAGCAAPEEPVAGRLRIVTTLFPQYDFARQLAGERAEVTLLLPPGVESHSYEPTPADIIKIANADLFVYTGQYMEPWAQNILDGVEMGGDVLDISTGIVLDPEDHDHAGETETEHAAHADHGHGGYDPHIWTDPVNARQMVQNLADALCAADPEGEAFYRGNERDYLEALAALDREFSEIVSHGKRREIVFGGRFALHYFAERYGLDYTAAFDSCSHETEPSAQVLARIIDTIGRERIPVIYYEELTDPKVARAISEETGAKMLLLHSCHNVSRDELREGATYLSLMRQNAENLKEGLNG
ncbi:MULTISPECIES: metal ABC transporter substrate-binding protein [Anaerotruncus]|jgi:zinc transport system substrate-binding protein|uniref:metal ABC transporter substrate-binding protein n=1 Tax=Anaerotruncus TaxID=244127 RepID=UPI001A9B7233|nr:MULTISPECIES: metal ABC transporter substrate-binding protein [Anaerotruncus]